MQFNECARYTELVEFWIRQDAIGLSVWQVRIERLHFTNAADRDNNMRIRGILEGLKTIDVGHFLPHFRFGVCPQLSESRCRNLEMKVATPPRNRFASFDEKRGCLQFL